MSCASEEGVQVFKILESSTDETQEIEIVRFAPDVHSQPFLEISPIRC